MFEKEFLQLAGIMLACRWKVMGHSVENDTYSHGDLTFSLLGLIDYELEMKLLIKVYHASDLFQVR